MILYAEDSKDSTKKTVRTEFSKTAGYKINIQISSHFKQQKWEIQKRNLENNSIYNSSKKNKILRSKYNQGDRRLIHWKLQIIAERN